MKICPQCGRKYSDLVEQCPACMIDLVLNVSKSSHGATPNVDKPSNRTKSTVSKPFHNISISAGDFHTVGLKADGTVIAIGWNNNGQCNTDSWHDIIAISAGGDHTVGLKRGGTVIAIGGNDYGQCNVNSWNNIIAISAGSSYTLGLRKDGTVIAVGDNDYGQCNVDSWTDIIAISSGCYHMLGLKKDGTVVATGENGEGECNIQSWNLKIKSNTNTTVGSTTSTTQTVSGASTTSSSVTGTVSGASTTTYSTTGILDKLGVATAIFVFIFTCFDYTIYYNGRTMDFILALIFNSAFFSSPFFLSEKAYKSHIGGNEEKAKKLRNVAIGIYFLILLMVFGGGYL